MRVVVAVRGAAHDLVDDLRAEGADVVAVVAPSELAAAVGGAVQSSGPVFATELLAVLGSAHVLVVDAGGDSVTDALVALCDRSGVRVVVRCERDAEHGAARAFGLRTVDVAAPASVLLDPEPPPPAEPRTRGRVIAVWGAAGAPGRTTMAIALASELARDGRRVALIDADSHAPSMALAIGLADEGPGFAAACRQAERGKLTVTELARIAAPLGDIAVLTGINRPGRWPELSADRVRAALDVCREWADDILVDVAACLELDEEIVSDLDGPRRNAATRAVLGCADIVVAVVSSDPVGVSRFIRAYPDLRAAVRSAPVRVLVNKTRPRVLGVDPRSQVRRTLERYAGIADVWFAPADGRAVDAALLRAQPVLQAAGRSALVAAVRRFVGEALEAPLRRRRADRPALRSRTRAGRDG